MREVVMPKSSMTMTEGELLSWLVSEGDEVSEGDPIAEIMTDKVDMEVEAPADGRVAILVEAGSTVPVGTVIGVVLAEDEGAPERGGDARPSSTHRAGRSVPYADTRPEVAIRGRSASEVQPVRRGATHEHNGVIASDGGSRDGDGRPRATPAARAMAKRMGIDLGTITGSGDKGRIRSADVALAAEQAAPPAAPRPAPADDESRADMVAAVRSRSRPTGVRGVMMRRMSAAAHVPQFTLFAEAAFVGVERGRKDRGASGRRIGVTEIVLRAVAMALEDHPSLNAHFLDGEIVEFSDINLGVAVDTDSGLIVPVLHRAQRDDVAGLSRKVAELASAARLGRLRPEEVEGATFTVTNLGMFGIDSFQPVVNPPQVAILSVGRSRGDAGRTTTFGLAADHRAVDGAQGARFLQRVRELIEHPEDVFGPPRS